MVKPVNTQTHLLLATALLLPAVPALTQRGSLPITDSEPSIRGFQATIAALIGAALPDASLFVMFFIAKAQGVADSVIWGEWYFSDFWQRIGAMTNSIPIYTALAFLAYAIRFHKVAIASLAALLHCFTDLPLHHNDGHPHFWPFSNWIYSSPVSYWDPAHYGNQWSIVELCLAALLIVFLWRRYANKWSRALLVITALSYGAVAFFWFTAFG